MLPMYFDTDHHLTEPPDFWTGRFSKKHADKSPFFMHHPELGPGWSWDGGKTVRPMGVQSVAAEDPRKIGNFKSFEELDPGCYDPKKRIEVMDVDGARACILFPSAVAHFHGFPDPDFYIECTQVFNDAALDWAAAGDAQRIFPAAVMPMLSHDSAVSEMQRCAAKGFKTYMFNLWPSNQPVPTADDDRYFAAAQEIGLTGSVHGFGGGRPTTPPPPPVVRIGVKAVKGMGQLGFSQELVAASRGAGLGITPQLAGFIFSGVLERFPKLKLAMIETSIGWLPYLAERMDALYLQHRWTRDDLKLKRLPSDYLHMIYANWDREWLGVDYRSFIGADTIMFGSDFPHIGSFYPHTRFYLDLLLRNIPLEEQEKLLWSNAARIYGIN
ncbi:MAG: amidohydrolase [Dehalococcoidia bacterium]|nr:amidohydrolase [Dehalococcoidia bacterium]